MRRSTWQDFLRSPRPQGDNYDQYYRSPSFFQQSSFRQRQDLLFCSNHLSAKKMGVSSFDDFPQPVPNTILMSNNNILSQKSLTHHQEQLQKHLTKPQVAESKIEQIINSLQHTMDICTDLTKSLDQKSQENCWLNEIVFTDHVKIEDDITPSQTIKMFEKVEVVDRVIDFGDQLTTEQQFLQTIVNKVLEFRLFFMDIIGKRDEKSDTTHSPILQKNSKAFVCKFCKAKFPRACSLGGHISRVHKQEIKKIIIKARHKPKRSKVLEQHLSQEVANVIQTNQ